METKRLSAEPDAIAPDGAEVRILLAVGGGSMAHFEIGPNETSVAIAHRTVEEIWYFVRGRGQMWRKRGDREEVVDVGEGVCLTIPVGTEFQFRSFGYESLAAIGVTIPPWPGTGEAVVASGPSAATASPGPT